MNRAEQLVARLIGLNSISEGLNDALAIVYKDRVVKDGILVCPHCHQEIHEKGTYSDDGGETMRHNVCKGVVQYKPPTESELRATEDAWNMKYDRSTGKWT